MDRKRRVHMMISSAAILSAILAGALPANAQIGGFGTSSAGGSGGTPTGATARSVWGDRVFDPYGVSHRVADGELMYSISQSRCARSASQASLAPSHLTSTATGTALKSQSILLFNPSL